MKRPNNTKALYLQPTRIALGEHRFQITAKENVKILEHFVHLDLFLQVSVTLQMILTKISHS